jgi:SAM-dependent methyltransferase
MDWRIKGVIQKTLSVMPGGVTVNDWLQRTLGGLRNFPDTVASKIEDWSLHMGHLRALEIALASKRVFEIGTGWLPVFPMCYALAGTGSCITVDLHRHMNQRLTLRLIRVLGQHLDQIATAVNAPIAEVRDRHAELSRASSVPDLLRRARVEYLAPGDATQTKLPDDSVDIVFSNSVLEHVTHDVLRAMMRESRRILQPGGLVMHSINCGDHYAYFDKRINFMNYLQFSEDAWQFWNNDLQYQNRLRPRHFIEATEDVGLIMRICKHKARPDLLAALPGMHIAPEFAGYPPEQLACKSIDIVAAKPELGPPRKTL